MRLQLADMLDCKSKCKIRKRHQLGGLATSRLTFNNGLTSTRTSPLLLCTAEILKLSLVRCSPVDCGSGRLVREARVMCAKGTPRGGDVRYGHCRYRCRSCCRHGRPIMDILTRTGVTAEILGGVVVEAVVTNGRGLCYRLDDVPRATTARVAQQVVSFSFRLKSRRS